VSRASLQVDDDIEMPSTPALADCAELFERHYTAVFRTALRVAGNPADAEDVLQTVFLRVVSRSDPEGLSDRPEAYFRRAAVNAAVDLLRRRAAHAETAYDDQTHETGAEPAGLLKEQLRRAVATLPDEDASLFLLRHVEGLSIDELAAMFRFEKNNVSVRLHRIRLRLQTEMQR
jgi:RNA polymerase sigma-70 factor (ECF subfamily)